MFGFMLHFDNTWQLIISTASAIISISCFSLFKTASIATLSRSQLKLDEIIRATKGAITNMMDIEKLTDDDLERIRKSMAYNG